MNNSLQIIACDEHFKFHNPSSTSPMLSNTIKSKTNPIILKPSQQQQQQQQPQLQPFATNNSNSSINYIPNNINYNENATLCQNPSQCLICTRSLPPCLSSRTVSWVSILRVVFYSLKQIYPEKEYFNLKKDVYGYVAAHWYLICSKKKKTTGWRKQLQDALSHCRRLFESGADHHECYGFWKLKDLSDPWEDTQNSNNNDNGVIGSPFSTPQSPMSPLESPSPILSNSNLNDSGSPKSNSGSPTHQLMNNNGNSNYYYYSSPSVSSTTPSSSNGMGQYHQHHTSNSSSSNSANSSPIPFNNLYKSTSTPSISSLSTSTKLFNCTNSFQPLRTSTNILKSSSIYDVTNLGISSPSFHSNSSGHSTPNSRPRSKSLCASSNLFESPLSLSKSYQNLTELKFSQPFILNPPKINNNSNNILSSPKFINNSNNNFYFNNLKKSPTLNDLSFIKEENDTDQKRENISNNNKLSISNLIN
ncbi:histidine kinase A [Tieghemostelium lacteum]|uniref:Histidine kinase A n=1 Tax=Tieghemostelium lacteum TaxID=361077 RepID=A0A152A306_TIELA|nr:histidine kinase A [Tieghemostelium lacteum]|eukprot:KYR00485.1 histidine kinase A [Tieghemostelium lacteum]